MKTEPQTKATEEKAANRLLDPDEMESPFFRRILARMDRLLAQEPDCYLHPSKRWEYPWALGRAELVPGSRVLDAGCGGSIFPRYLAAEGYRVSAVDFVLPSIAGSPLGNAVDYLRADLIELPFASGSFDTVFCISVLEHLSEDGIARALTELRRVLKKGGRLLLTTDFYEDAGASIRYEGPGESFPVDWNIFDEQLLESRLLSASGYRLEGDIDLAVDWEATRAAMRRFHGYPYTSVGITLVAE